MRQALGRGGLSWTVHGPGCEVYTRVVVGARRWSEFEGYRGGYTYIGWSSRHLMNFHRA